MKQKAFTLVELLAVIVILAVVVIITIPIVTGIISESKKATFMQSIEGILESVRVDSTMNVVSLPSEYFYNMGILTLVTQQKESENRQIAMKGKLDGRGFVYIDKDGIRVSNICSKSYCANGLEDNIIITDNKTGELPEYNVSDPVIHLNGSEIIYLELNDTYQELGATAMTIGGKTLEYTTEIKLQDNIVASIDTKEENTYTIIYKATNDGKVTTVQRTVVITDMTPVIILTEASTKFVKTKDVLITTSAIKPNTIVKVQYKIIKDGKIIQEENSSELVKNVHFSETGNYEIEVIVKDNNNHTKTEKSGIYKIDVEPPRIEFTETKKVLNFNEVPDFQFEEDETVKVTDNSGIVSWNVIGELTTEVGEQTVTYVVTDEAGNETRVDRTFEITSENGPVINYSSASSDGIWIGATTITIYARIETEDDELTQFSYQVDDKEEVNVEITNNKQMEVEVPLTTTGKHKIKIKATGSRNNVTQKTIGEFLIDKAGPVVEEVVEEITENPDSWVTRKTITGTITDHESTVTSYYIMWNNPEKPALGIRGWVSVSEPASTCTFEAALTRSGTYYIWGQDEFGNVSEEAYQIVLDKVDSRGPVVGSLSVSNADTWAKSKTITGTITETESNITHYYVSKSATKPVAGGRGWYEVPEASKTYEFSYEVSTGGTYYVWALDEVGNVTAISASIVVSMVDSVGPTVGTINGNTSSWTTSKTITTTITDADNKVAYYAIIKNDSTKPTADSKVWNKITEIKSYSVSETIKENGTYYLWGKDNLGNITATSKSVTISKIDTEGPIIEMVRLTDSSDTYCSNQNENYKPYKITIKDSGSGVKYFAITGLIVGQPASDSSKWVEIPVTSSYELTSTYYACYNSMITGGNNYDIWGKDALGNITEIEGRAALIKKK